MTDNSGDDVPAPVEISRLKMSLKHGCKDNRHVHFDVLQEMIRNSAIAKSLLPDVLDMHRAGTLKVSPDSLADLYLAVPRPEILDALEESGTILSLSTLKKCELFEWGVTSLQQPLLDVLWGIFHGPELGREEIVRALGVCGKQDALEMLLVIQDELAGTVPEARAKLLQFHEGDLIPPEVDMKAGEIKANAQFLQLLRETTVAMRKRLAEDA